MKPIAAYSIAALFAAGCMNVTVEDTGKGGTRAETGSASPPADTSALAATVETTTLPGKVDPVPVPIESGVAALSPENTRLEFVGTHNKDPDPDPRTGTFQKFSGTVEVDAESQALTSIVVDIDTTTVKAAIDKLTNHLNQPDFFDTREYPTAKFESTEITPGGGEGQFNVKGNLTLHGTTKEISFPITTTLSDAGLTATADFIIDRREFGMDQNLQGVKPDVAMTVIIGEKNRLPTASE